MIRKLIKLQLWLTAKTLSLCVCVYVLWNDNFFAYSCAHQSEIINKCITHTQRQRRHHIYISRSLPLFKCQWQRQWLAGKKYCTEVGYKKRTGSWITGHGHVDTGWVAILISRASSFLMLCGPCIMVTQPTRTQAHTYSQTHTQTELPTSIV